MRFHHQGFSLLEMAVVIFIISLLLLSFIKPLSLQREIEQIQSTKATLTDIRQALIVYAITEKRLPCPDINNLNDVDEGQENRKPNKTCQQQYGFLPWAELGMPRFDPWGQRYLYRVDSAFSKTIPSDGLTNNNMRIRDPFDGSNLTSTNAAGESPISAVVYSCGMNKVNNQVLNTPQSSCLATSSATFSQGNLIEGTANNSFDDYITWLPSNVLLYHLLSAGKWRGPN